MKVQIERSKEFVAKLMIETGANHPQLVIIEVDPALLSKEVRAAIITNRGGYPDTITSFWYDKMGDLLSPGKMNEGSQFFYLDAREEDITQEDVNIVLLEALDKIKNEIKPKLIEKENKKKQEFEQRITDFLNNKDIRVNNIWAEYVDLPYVGRIDAKNCTRYNEVREVAENHLAGIKAMNEERNRIEEEKNKKIAQEKRDTINAWVEKFGNDNQRGRLKLNLLPDDEILAEIRGTVFEELSSFPRYEKIRSNEIKCSCEYDDQEIEFNVTDSDSATPENFELLNKIMGIMPSAKVVLRDHIGFCERCHNNDLEDGEIQRKSILATVEHGGFTFSREFAV